MEKRGGGVEAAGWRCLSQLHAAVASVNGRWSLLVSSAATSVIYCRSLLSFAGSFTSRCFLLERKGRSRGEEEERGAGGKRRRERAWLSGSSGGRRSSGEEEKEGRLWREEGRKRVRGRGKKMNIFLGLDL